MCDIAISTEKYVDGRSPDINWEKLNTSFQNTGVDHWELIDCIYQGHPFCAWMNGKRSADSFLRAQHVGIDMDNMDYRSSFDALVEHPLVVKYGAIIYQTGRHQPHAPRSRVLFLLDEPIETANGYRLALETVHSMFEEPDPSCIDPARFFFGNGKLARDKNSDGIWFSENISFPLADLRMYAKQYLKNKKQSEAQETTGHRQYVPQGEVSLDYIAGKLTKVDPYAPGYDLWLTAMTGLKNEFGDAAFAVAKEWSDVAGKKPLTKAKWDSFGKAGKPCTIASVMKVIKECSR